MARIVAAFGTSHSVMLAATLEDWLTRFRESDRRMPYFDREGRRIGFDDVLARAPTDAGKHVTPEAIAVRFEEVQAAMAELKSRIARAKLDVLVVVGDDQYELFHDEHIPAIAIYYGGSIRNAARRPIPPEDWYRVAQSLRLEPGGEREYPCDGALALHLIEGLVAREFDVAALSGLKPDQAEGHAYAFVHRWYLQGTSLPIVPVFLNTYNPPNAPLPRRCLRFGEAVKALVEAYPADVRVGILASGGLSHFVVEEDLDRAVIHALRNKDHAALVALDPNRLKGGSSEIRNWIVVAGAALGLELDWISYTPAYRTQALTGTGLAFAAWS